MGSGHGHRMGLLPFSFGTLFSWDALHEYHDLHMELFSRKKERNYRFDLLLCMKSRHRVPLLMHIDELGPLLALAVARSSQIICILWCLIQREPARRTLWNISPSIVEQLCSVSASLKSALVYALSIRLQQFKRDVYEANNNLKI